MKVALYARVSRDDLNLENQKLALIAECSRRGFTYELFEESESTRKTRPIKEQLMMRLRRREFEAVMVYKLDRWARSLQELIMNLTELRERGIHFISMTQPFDTSSSSGILMVQILGAFAEFEREMIRERTIAGLERAKSKGIKLGRPKGAIKKGGILYLKAPEQ